MHRRERKRGLGPTHSWDQITQSLTNAGNIIKIGSGWRVLGRGITLNSGW